MPLACKQKSQCKRRWQNYSVILLINLSLLFSLNATANSLFVMPDMANIIDLAIDYGEIEALVGQRHYSDELVLGWDQQRHQNSEIPVFHAYGFGGGGLTLAPAVAQQINSHVIAALKERKDKNLREVLVFGAGYIGVFAAYEIYQQLLKEGLADIPVTVVAHSFTRGISSLRPDIPEPTLNDNFSSQIAGGWVMPVSVEPLSDTDLWCQMVNDAQIFWKNLAEDPEFSTTVRMTQSLVFYETGQKGKHLTEDKSGIRTINKTCKPELYPEHEFNANFHTRSLENDRSIPLYFQHVTIFDNIVEADTNSILKHYTAELLSMGINLVYTPENISDFQTLVDQSQHKYPVIVNASGHGAFNIFAGKPTWPIRGDLVVLRIPTTQLTQNLEATSKFTYWAGGTNYIFMRYSLDGNWLEVVLGGTFLENDDDLTPRRNTVRDITGFWLSLLHMGTFDLTMRQRERVQKYSDKVVNKLFE